MRIPCLLLACIAGCTDPSPDEVSAELVRPPDSLVAASASSTEIALAWRDNSANEIGFQLAVATNDAFTGATTIALPADSTSFLHGGLAPITTYWYRVKAVRMQASAWSAPAFATTAPGGVAATALAPDSVEVTWGANPDNPRIIGYTVRYSVNEDFTGAEYRWVPGAATARVTLAELASGTTYFLRVKAESGAATPAYSSGYSTTVTATTTGATLPGTPIGARFFGLNAWMPDWVGDDQRFGDLEQVLCGDAYQKHGDPCVPGVVLASGVKLVRYGGIAVDEHYDPDLSPTQYLDMVDHIRANGAEPLLQVPYFDGAYDAALAAEIVRHVNVTHGRGVRYWTISNEPSHYGATTAEIATTFREYAKAMKAVDPDILITGPDLSYYDTSVMYPLTDPASPYDLTGSYLGSDGKTHYYLDIINFHTYPFKGDSSQSRANVIARPQGRFQEDLVDLRDRIKSCNEIHGRAETAPILLAVTEINIDWKNPADMSVTGQGPSSFLNGQYWADTMNVGMKLGLELIAFWSIVEGSQLGYLRNDHVPQPTYHHYKMIASRFRGVYVAGSSPDPLLKVFGSRDVDQIVVMILDQQRGTPALDYSVRLALTPGALSVDAGLDVEWHADAPLDPESTVMLIFDAAGRLREKQVYGLAQAKLGDPPVVTTY